MSLVVQKYGGSSVGDAEQIKRVAQRIVDARREGNDVVVIVSAMGDSTDDLLDLAQQVSPLPPPRELDMLLTAGERISMALLAMAIANLGFEARSFTGSQAGVITDSVHGRARIIDVAPGRIRQALDSGYVAIVAGFQGVSQDTKDITTLGRGGSDTTAVALAAALNADVCEIYTDVDGVFTADPRKVSNAKKLARISYEEMLEMASLGAKVLQTRSVELAMAQRVPVRVLSSFVEPGEAPGPDGQGLGTIVCDEEEIMEKRIVSGVAYSRDEAKISLFGLPDHPGVSSEIFGRLADANVNVDMIVQSHARTADTANMEFTVGKRDAARAVEIVRAAQPSIGFDDVAVNEEVSKVSVIGVGMRSHTGVAKTMFQALAEKGVNIQVISTSEIKISVLIDAAYTELAVRALHAAYGLDQL
jgi:aspartate kinase